MIFSSIDFFIFLGAVLAVIFLLGAPRFNRQKKLFLLGASYFFYGYWDWRFLSLILLSTIVDWVVGTRLHRAEDTSYRKKLLSVSVICNLGILGFFKYNNFFIDNLRVVLSPIDMNLDNLDIILPVGISFYTFQTMSYTIDIYRKKIKPAQSFTEFALFVAFFPQLVAGPIVRAREFLPQLERNIRLSSDNMRAGFELFFIGLVKKVLIADRLSYFVDHVFETPDLYSSGTIWLAVISYGIQIFCDFSGYSDMAIGTARMLGFRFCENFRMPYISRSITEFWRRWHISLSSWLRDYLYLSLGGNRRGVRRTYVNLMIVMLLGGLWHGASWNFIVWGGLHGIALGVHKYLLAGRRSTGDGSDAGPWMSVAGWLVTFVFVHFCWVFFRAESFSTAFLIIGKMLYPVGATRWYFSELSILIPVVVLSHVVGIMHERRNETFVIPFYRMYWRVAFVFAICSLIVFFPRGINPFVYFQF